MSVQAPWNDLLAEPLPRDHLVQLYHDDRVLIEAVALFAGRGLGKGEGVILVAARPHLDALERRLTQDGFEVDDFKRWRQLTVLDAEEMLSRFMVDGTPDAERFKSLAGGVIASTRAAGWRKVRIYGEMVNVIWKQNLAGAARLEQLWNEVIQTFSVSLFCAYGVARDGEARRRFPSELREAHSRLIPFQAVSK